MLKSRPNVEDYLDGDLFKANKLHVDQAQCDQLPGFSCFSIEVFGFPPNICGNHITGNYRVANHLFLMFDVVGAQVLPRPAITMSNISKACKPAKSMTCFTSRSSE
jgi:hypothetical protein